MKKNWREIKCYNKALEIDPSHERAKRNKQFAEEKLKEKRMNVYTHEWRVETG